MKPAKKDIWENLTISNDFLFKKLMSDREICKEVLENLLHLKVGNIVYLEEEKSIDILCDAKSIRLDVYVKDEDKIYNVEMQVSDKADLAKRSRYYQAMIDLNTIEKGETYNKLKESFVVFICTFDPFKKGLPKYTFQNICIEDNAIKLEDGINRVFFNTRDYNKENDENIQAFLKYVNGQKVNNTFIDKIDQKVKQIKENKEWRLEYMTLLMRDNENIEKGFEKGLQQGIEQGMQQGIEQGMQQGIEQGMQQGIKNQIRVLRKFNVSEEEIITMIVEDYNITAEEVRKYLQ